MMNYKNLLIFDALEHLGQTVVLRNPSGIRIPRASVKPDYKPKSGSQQQQTQQQSNHNKSVPNKCVPFIYTITYTNMLES